MSDNKLVIIGAGELGRQALHFARLQGKYNVIGFVDDIMVKGTLIDGVPTLGSLEDIDQIYEKNEFDFLFIAIGYKHFNFRDDLFNRLIVDGHRFATIIAPHVWIDPTATIGDGCLLYPGTVVDKEAMIDHNTIINLSVTIGHNTHVGQSTFIAGESMISGFCEIGRRCMIGVNSTIIDNVHIADDVVVGAASCIRKHINDCGTFIDGKFFIGKYLEKR